VEDADRAEVHCSVFTPESFLDLLRRLFDIDLLPAYEVAAFHPTEPGSVEFNVALRRLPDLDPSDRRARQLASLPTSVPWEDVTRPADLSRFEWQMIGAKRRAMAALRRVPGESLERWFRRSRRR
jgi:hypothetical protein